jgi:hypothetical protein
LIWICYLNTNWFLFCFTGVKLFQYQYFDTVSHCIVLFVNNHFIIDSF